MFRHPGKYRDSKARQTDSTAGRSMIPAAREARTQSSSLCASSGNLKSLNERDRRRHSGQASENPWLECQSIL